MKRFQSDFTSFSVVYCEMPPTARTEEPSISEKFALGLSFTSHDNTLLEYSSGRTNARVVLANTGGMTSGDPPAWIEVLEPSECVEFRPGEDLRTSIANEFGVPHAAEFADIANFSDPVLWAAAVRYRAHALGGWPLENLEADVLIHCLMRQMIMRCLGGKAPRATMRQLDNRRIRRVADYVQANLAAELSIDVLAGVAAVSRYHFIRAFKATTGLTPHKYVLGRRMDAAKELLLCENMTLSQVAERVGYTNGHYFRQAFSQYFGCAPSTFAKR